MAAPPAKKKKPADHRLLFIVKVGAGTSGWRVTCNDDTGPIDSLWAQTREEALRWVAQHLESLGGHP